MEKNIFLHILNHTGIYNISLHSYQDVPYGIIIWDT